MIQKPFSIKLTKEREEQLLAEIKNMSQQLFPGGVRVSLEADYEIPNDEFYAFNVVASGTSDEIAANCLKWNKLLSKIAPDAPGRFRLSLNVA